MIESEVVEFNQWLNMLGVVPVISALRQKALGIQADTMVSLQRKLPHLSERDIKVLNKHTKSIINQMLKDPILYAKELADESNTKEALNDFVKTFRLEELIEEQFAVSNEQDQVVTKAAILHPTPVRVN
jgi:glutamyl-tRNA reductase